MNNTLKIALISLGCEKNTVNSEQMLWILKNEKHIVTSEIEGSDVVILNTCGFIESAVSEAIDHIIELGILKNEGKIGKLIVCGCLAERYRDGIFTEMPEVDGVVGCGGFADIARAVNDAAAGGRVSLFPDIDAAVDETPRILSTPKHFAYLKIAEGCDNRCAYCIIPKLRGRYRSRPLEKIIDEAKSLVSAGAKELILIAQDTSRYGTDLYGKARLPELLSELCKLDGLSWLRIHYLYPDSVTDELISVIASEPKIVKYLDIPVQHVSDEILRRMNRRGGKAEITALFKKIRQKIPDLVIRTTVICGLPGETEQEFDELLNFLKTEKLQRAGAFAYSPEEGTAAYSMTDRVSPEEAAARAEIVRNLQARIMDEYNASLIGRGITVLCEGYDPGNNLYSGRSYADSPEIDGKIYFKSKSPAQTGDMYEVVITGEFAGEPLGEYR